MPQSDSQVPDTPESPHCTSSEVQPNWEISTVEDPITSRLDELIEQQLSAGSDPQEIETTNNSTDSNYSIESGDEMIITENNTEPLSW